VTNLRLIPDTPAAPGTVREVIAWAIDDWLESTAPTDDQPGGEATTWCTADIAEHVIRQMEAAGCRIATDNRDQPTTH
jgi:hypothetical protein